VTTPSRRRRSTVNQTWTILRAALNYAFHDEKVNSDLAWRKVNPFKGVDAARARYLSIAEAKRLINACAPDFRLLVQAARKRAPACGELARLTASGFNADSGTIHIRQSKSSKARHVVLSDEGQRLFEQLTAGRDGNDLILLKTNGRDWNKSEQKRPMAQTVKRAKISPAISFRVLRHTPASHSAMNGVPLFFLAKNLGHGDTRMVGKIWAPLTELCGRRRRGRRSTFWPRIETSRRCGAGDEQLHTIRYRRISVCGKIRNQIVG
jgi:integrase